MSEFQWVHLLWLIGAFILVAGGLAAHKLSWNRGLRLALIWIGLFVGLTLFIDVVR